MITRAGTEATLECKVRSRSCDEIVTWEISRRPVDSSIITQVEAAPRSVNYWMKVTGGAAKEPEAVNPGRRVSVAEVAENAYTQRMVLRLAEVRARDFGTYICIARNSLGDVRVNVQLQGEECTECSECTECTGGVNVQLQSKELENLFILMKFH